MAGIMKVRDKAIVNVEYFSDTVIGRFIASRHCSPNTAKTYRNSIRQLLKFFVSKSITAPTTSDVDDFINMLRADKKSDSTLRLYTTTTKLFFAYLDKQGIYANVAADSAPLKLRKSNTHKKKSLTDTQAKKLLAAVKGNSEVALRDKAIIALALQTGLRTCELSRADIGDLKDAGDYFTLDVQGKGRLKADDTVKVAPQVAEMILAYLEVRGGYDTLKATDSPLFTSTSNNISWQKNQYGVRLSEQSIGKMIKARMKSVGIDDARITAHSTRHYTLTRAIKSGCDLREVSELARHSNLNITMTYLHDISLETRRAEMAVADVLFASCA